MKRYGAKNDVGDGTSSVAVVDGYDLFTKMQLMMKNDFKFPFNKTKLAADRTRTA